MVWPETLKSLNPACGTPKGEKPENSSRWGTKCGVSCYNALAMSLRGLVLNVKRSKPLFQRKKGVKYLRILYLQ